MGAGGSIETDPPLLDYGSTMAAMSSTTHPRYFCHGCNRIFQASPSLGPMHQCILCGSGFIEEYSSAFQPLPVHSSHHNEMSAEQTRRITNATAMLRLLETQLREELEQLQQAVDQTNQRNRRRQDTHDFSDLHDLSDLRNQKLTAAMKVKLRQTEVTLDSLCSQPSCPICSEDFVIGSKECKLPCSHVFHEKCVVPWLEMKHNCPICRATLTDSIPEVTELLALEVNELDDKLKDLGVEVADMKDQTK
jgi:hypothetical protein